MALPPNTRSSEAPAAGWWFSSWLSPPFAYMVAKSEKKHQCAKIGFADLTGMVSCDCIRLSRNSEGLTLHLFPLGSPNRTPISQKYFWEKEKALSEIDRKGLSAYALIHYFQEVTFTSWRTEDSPATHVPNLSTWNFGRILWWYIISKGKYLPFGKQRVRTISQVVKLTTWNCRLLLGQIDPITLDICCKVVSGQIVHLPKNHPSSKISNW